MKLPPLKYVYTNDWILKNVAGKSVLHLGCVGDHLPDGPAGCLHIGLAQVTDVLWGSTSTKNPEYSDVKYVTELITKPTVNTIPEKTFDAFLDHGEVSEAFNYEAVQSQSIIDSLKDRGINIDHICQDLLRDGVVAFEDAFEALLVSIEKKASELCVK